MNCIETGKKLYNLRASLNKTRAQVAKETGITPSALSNYENGLRTPRDEVKKRLANYYNLSIETLFFTE